MSWKFLDPPLLDANDLKYVVIFIFSLEMDVIFVINVLVDLWRGV